MRYLHAGGARLFGPLLATAMATLAVGCEAGISGSAGAPVVVTDPPQGEAPPVVAASTDVDTDLVYEPEAPVADIEGYPYVVYGGVNVYFVDGRWYRHGRDGWGYFRSEPPELGRQRAMHDHDARWTRSAGGPSRADRERPGEAEHQAPERTTPERPGVAERQAPERIAPPRETTPPTKGAEAKKKAVKKVAPTRAAPAREPSEKEPRR